MPRYLQWFVRDHRVSVQYDSRQTTSGLLSAHLVFSGISLPSFRDFTIPRSPLGCVLPSARVPMRVACRLVVYNPDDATDFYKCSCLRRHGESGLDQLRAAVIECSRRMDKALVFSYDRQGVGQAGSGHFSPLGGYNEAEDLVLVLDTARFKYPPHWIKLDREAGFRIPSTSRADSLSPPLGSHPSTPLPACRSMRSSPGALWSMRVLGCRCGQICWAFPNSGLHGAMKASDAMTGRPRGYLVMERDDTPASALRLFAVGTIQQNTARRVRRTLQSIVSLAWP